MSEDVQVWIGDQGPYEGEIVEETHEGWDSVPSVPDWYRWGERVQETGTAIFHVYCCQQHAEDGGDCLSFLGVDAPWRRKHSAELLCEDGLVRTKEIGALASYRETILRQRNRRRLTEQRSRR